MSNNIVAQRYRIINTLGEGGSGITYLAQDFQNNKNVALKALSLHRINDWKALELFEREAKILAQLNHPAIPDYLEYFDAETNGEKHFYIAQQLAPGDSLAKLVENNWRTNEQQIKDIAKQILEILIYLHSLKPPVTHRDIKPQNIIRDKNGKVFLVDFGAVQDTYYSTFMRGSTVVGTYGYMAPEQFRGQAVPATDLYGLGATLLFLLTHRSPADFPTDGLKIDFRSRVKVSEDFADWLDKMLEPDLEERFSSAKVALEVLRGKRKIILGKQKPILWKSAIAMGISVISILVSIGFFNNYKWGILDIFGFQPPETTCSNLDTMRDYINKGGNPNTEVQVYLFEYKKSLLVCAIEADAREMTEFLIAKGAKVDNALHEVKTVEDAKYLIAKGADVNHKNKYGWTPLHYAVTFYRKEIAELLLSHQADINAKNQDGDTALHLITQDIKSSQKHFSTNYIAREVNHKNFNINTQFSILKLIFDNNAKIDETNNDGYTALHFAALQSHPNVIEFLLHKGADINKQAASNGRTPLMLAAEKNGSLPVIELLIDNGADVTIRDKEGFQAHRIAINNGNREVGSRLVREVIR